METEIREGVGKQAYRDYAQALNKWLIPYFGGTDIAKLDLAAVTAFDAWRTAQNGRGASTEHHQQSQLSTEYRVLDEAELNGWIVKSLRPTLLNKGVQRPKAEAALALKNIAHDLHGTAGLSQTNTEREVSRHKRNTEKLCVIPCQHGCEAWH